MRVGVVAARKFPDEKMRDRLVEGSKADCKLVIRKRDYRLLDLLEQIEAENVEVWDPAYTWIDTTEAKSNAFLADVDHLLVFHVEKSTTDYFVKKARDWPYSISFAPKTTIVEAKHERRTVPGAQRRRPARDAG